MSGTLGDHAPVAVEPPALEPVVLEPGAEPVEAHADHEPTTVLDERERIAHDLDDRVIQRLFTLGLNLHGLASRVDGPEAERVAAIVDDVDGIIAEIRSSIFALRQDEEGEA